MRVRVKVRVRVKMRVKVRVTVPPYCCPCTVCRSAHCTSPGLCVCVCVCGGGGGGVKGLRAWERMHPTVPTVKGVRGEGEGGCEGDEAVGGCERGGWEWIWRA